MAPPVALRAALPQLSDHLDRLLEHLQAHIGVGPGVAEDVLVEGLAAAHSERELAVEQHRRGRGGLRDHRRMDPHRRTGHGGGDVHARNRRRDRADRRPDKRTVALLMIPRVVVIGDPQALEPGVVCSDRLGDQIPRAPLLRRQEVPDLHLRSSLTLDPLPAQSPPNQPKRFPVTGQSCHIALIQHAGKSKSSGLTSPPTDRSCTRPCFDDRTA